MAIPPQQQDRDSSSNNNNNSNNTTTNNNNNCETNAYVCVYAMNDNAIAVFDSIIDSSDHFANVLGGIVQHDDDYLGHHVNAIGSIIERGDSMIHVHDIRIDYYDRFSGRGLC